MVLPPSITHSPHCNICPKADVHDVGGPYFHRIYIVDSIE